jgi:hypothetical protein
MTAKRTIGGVVFGSVLEDSIVKDVLTQIAMKGAESALKSEPVLEAFERAIQTVIQENEDNTKSLRQQVKDLTKRADQLQQTVDLQNSVIRDLETERDALRQEKEQTSKKIAEFLGISVESSETPQPQPEAEKPVELAAKKKKAVFTPARIIGHIPLSPKESKNVLMLPPPKPAEIDPEVGRKILSEIADRAKSLGCKIEMSRNGGSLNIKRGKKSANLALTKKYSLKDAAIERAARTLGFEPGLLLPTVSLAS